MLRGGGERSATAKRAHTHTHPLTHSYAHPHSHTPTPTPTHLHTHVHTHHTLLHTKKHARAHTDTFSNACTKRAGPPPGWSHCRTCADLEPHRRQAVAGQALRPQPGRLCLLAGQRHCVAGAVFVCLAHQPRVVGRNGRTARTGVRHTRRVDAADTPQQARVNHRGKPTPESPVSHAHKQQPRFEHPVTSHTRAKRPHLRSRWRAVWVRVWGGGGVRGGGGGGCQQPPPAHPC